MARLTKKQKEAVAKIEKSKIYSLQEASVLVKEITNTKFDASGRIAFGVLGKSVGDIAEIQVPCVHNFNL